MSLATQIPKVKLSSGFEIPVLGLGTWESPKGAVGEAVKYAISIGIRHLDFAAAYLNQKEIGDALAEVFKEGKVKREELFITSKLFNGFHHPDHVDEAINSTLADLQLTYLDLYLVHWPIAHAYPGPGNIFTLNDPKTGFRPFENVPFHVTWGCMEKFVEQKKVRTIGVANCPVVLLHDILTYAKIPPAVNQIEIHPLNQCDNIVNYCKLRNIHVTAYSPLGRLGVFKDLPSIVDSPILQKIAAKHKKTIPQIAIKWGIQRGDNVSLIPKSVKKERIDENFKIFDFQLDADDLAEIKKVNQNLRLCNPLKYFGEPLFD